MPLDIVGIMLGAALLHAAWNAIIKRGAIRCLKRCSKPWAAALA
jgi:hypothetical protein